jgi:ABC-type bacteriocin/lantibiotic exporter with double-glycine peptidase domain
MMPLNVPQWRQRQPGECLAACAAMVLTYLGEHVAYAQLVQQLGTSDVGTVFSHLDRLRSWRLTVERGRGSTELLRQHLAAGRPVIVPVDTALLPYWLTRSDLPEAERLTDHAVVVVAIDELHVYVNDPDFEQAPQVIELGWFQDAWRNFAQRYAVIRRRWPRRQPQR